MPDKELDRFKQAINLTEFAASRGYALDSGIAIGPILFVIAILGILVAAIAAGSGAFNANTTSESDKALAQAIIDYAEQVQNGVDLVLGRGCSDTEISFHAPLMANLCTLSDCDNVNPGGFKLQVHHGGRRRRHRRGLGS